MTTQTQSKGKKKNKEVTRVSLDEFNQIDAPHGHSVVSLKMTGLDWAETMADYDQQASESQQIIVPAAPRAQRGPAIDMDSLPTEPPFRVSLFNLPMSADEKEVAERFFHKIDVKKVEISKTSTTVELGSRIDLYDALCKDGSSMRNRTINVCLYGQSPQNNFNPDRYGGRGNSSLYGDRYSDRNSGGFGGPKGGDRFGDRAGGFNRDRSSYSGTGGGFNRGGGGYNQQPRVYGDRYNDRNSYREQRGSYTHGGGEPTSDESNDWRARPNLARPSPPPSHGIGHRQPYSQPRHEPTHYQHHHQNQPQHQAPPSHYQPSHQQDSYYQPRYQHNQSSNHLPYQDQSNQINSRPAQPPAPQGRPKLVLEKRKLPLNLDDVPVRNEAIFGKTKPSSTPYEKMKEVEEKLSAAQISDKKDVKGSSSPTTSQAGSGSSPNQQPQAATQSVPAPGQKQVSESQQDNSTRVVKN